AAAATCLVLDLNRRLHPNISVDAGNGSWYWTWTEAETAACPWVRQIVRRNLCRVVRVTQKRRRAAAFVAYRRSTHELYRRIHHCSAKGEQTAVHRAR